MSAISLDIAYSLNKFPASPSRRTSFAPARPPIDVAMDFIIRVSPDARRSVSSASLAWPGPQRINGVELPRVSTKALMTFERKLLAMLAECRISPRLPPPRIVHVAPSRNPRPVTWNMMTSSVSTTTNTTCDWPDAFSD